MEVRPSIYSSSCHMASGRATPIAISPAGVLGSQRLTGEAKLRLLGLFSTQPFRHQSNMEIRRERAQVTVPWTADGCKERLYRLYCISVGTPGLRSSRGSANQDPSELMNTIIGNDFKHTFSKGRGGEATSVHIPVAPAILSPQLITMSQKQSTTGQITDATAIDTLLSSAMIHFVRHVGFVEKISSSDLRRYYRKRLPQSVRLTWMEEKAGSNGSRPCNMKN